VTVRDTFRHQGIGFNIVQRLLEKLTKDGIHWIGLIAENQTQGFYSPLGFLPMADSTAMVKIIP
jgi:N-acetylglutamate synthase-like GNAT family acetyltransferase